MRELTINEIQAVGGGQISAMEGAAMVGGLLVAAPVGFALGFGIAVMAGLAYASIQFEM